MKLQVIVAPYDVERRDTNAARAPREMLSRGLLDRLREAGWDAQASEIQVAEAGKAETVVAVGRALARAVALARSEGRLPLVLSGGCLASLGTVAALQADGADPAVVWIDAHGDFNTPASSASGYWDGMALATLCGGGLPDLAEAIGLRPLPVSGTVHLAGRDFDPAELENIRCLGLETLPPAELGGEPAWERLRRRAAGRNLYLHVDLDGLDSAEAPAVAVPVPGGPCLEDLLRGLAALPAPAAVTFSALGFDGIPGEQAARTMDTCLRLIAAAGLK